MTCSKTRFKVRKSFEVEILTRDQWTVDDVPTSIYWYVSATDVSGVVMYRKDKGLLSEQAAMFQTDSKSS